MNDRAMPRLPTRFGFLLIDDFTLISMSSAIETLRMANRLSGEEVYAWKTISETGAAVCASDGLCIKADCGIDDDDVFQDMDAILVCGGRRVEKRTTERVLRWLKKAAKAGLQLGSTCTGSYVLAKAGVLDGYRCSIHWENIASLTDLFPKVQVRRSIYTIDRDRLTSSGGTTPIDMMLYLVRRQCGPEVTAGVAEQFVYERVRNPDDLQRVPLRHFVGKQSMKLVTAVELMEANIREPISQIELADYVDLSRRQLQRLFQKYLLCTPSRYYLQLRLQRARELLLQTDLSLFEIGAQTGFVSSSHFSKSYKEFYGYSPSNERRGDRKSSPRQ
ncbi:MAG: GlxA family transcriptional regulator [Gammaproteobacteria bacterium]|nr:GlxA family transcriptional regulator [Gammaproteobacteria bacterium]